MHNPISITDVEWKIPQYKINTAIYSVCVLTGLWTEQYDQIMRWWGSESQLGIAQVLDSAAHCYVILPRLPYYSNPRRSYHTSSSAHLDAPCLCSDISAYHMSSFSHMDVSCLRPRIPTSCHVAPPPSGSYYVTLSPNLLLLLASRKIPAKVSQSCFSVASWCHQASLLCPPPL